MSINEIPKKTPHSSRPPTPLANTLVTNPTSGEEEGQPDEDEVNN